MFFNLVVVVCILSSIPLQSSHNTAKMSASNIADLPAMKTNPKVLGTLPLQFRVSEPI
jgi:hypothetical protein